MSTPTPGSRKQPITLAQLSSYDDILTDALVDHVYYWTTIPKNRPSYHASRGVTEEEISKIIQSHLIVDPDIEIAESKLLATSGLSRFLNALKTPKEKDDFRAHLRRYMRIYLPDCPFEVASTNRYTIYSHEAAITARKYIKRGQSIKYLSGIQVMITAKEDKELAKRKKDFSIVVSSRNKCAALFMGPARFANHDCNANARLMITGQAGIEIVATQNIDVGDEITVSYAENYFGEDNCECLCKTCETRGVNGWSQPEGENTLKISIEDSPQEGDGYSLRRRRREDSCASASRTSSVTPDIRPRVRKTRPKGLNGSTDRESLLNSPAPHNLLREKRKREFESLQSPPVTPAKRLKTLQYEVEPVPIQAGLKRQSSHDATSSEQSAFDSTSTDPMVITDATTPEKEPREILLQSPALTPVRSRTVELKQEDTDLSNFGMTSTPPALTTESLAHHNETVGARSPSMDCKASITIQGKIGELPCINVATIPAPITAVADEKSLFSKSPGTESDKDQELERGRGRGRGRPRTTDEDKTEGTNIKSAKKRVPGDYTLTPALLSEPNMAWIHCTVCNDAFVQQNAYFTRSSCYRCERHSKLYGYQWPKTEKEGPSDKEERILDHRTVHRFLDPEDEAKIRGRKAPSAYVQSTLAPPVRKAAAPAKRGPGRPKKPTSAEAKENDDYEYVGTEEEESTTPLRRTRRRRTQSLKAVKC
ncbi:hypothetical protein F5Y16DRAFT_360530 [Xylariaceae sp. FL0255]|nr:hypothetical protein F5Y16DRAFT_360530 [Xylariaceae sp. FL0255]